MKKALVLVILGVILLTAAFWLGGCESYAQLGETKAEGNRRHQRVLRVNREEMMGDVDRVMLLDKPSRTTDKRIP